MLLTFDVALPRCNVLIDVVRYNKRLHIDLRYSVLSIWHNVDITNFRHNDKSLNVYGITVIDVALLSYACNLDTKTKSKN